MDVGLPAESVERCSPLWPMALLAAPAICFALTFVLPFLPDGSEPFGPCYGTSLVHIRLLGEATDAWSPALAREVAPMINEILAAPGHDPAPEAWEFVPGNVVRCEQRALPGGNCLVAVALAETPPPASRTSPR